MQINYFFNNLKWTFARLFVQGQNLDARLSGQMFSKHHQLSEQPACKVVCIPVPWKRPVGFASVFLCAGKTYGSGPGDLSPNPITQLSHAKSPLMVLHVPELRMMMFANESSVDIPYWKRWPLHTELPRGPTA